MTLLIYLILVAIAQELIPTVNATSLYIVGVIVWLLHVLWTGR